MLSSIQGFLQRLAGFPLQGSLRHKAFQVISIYRSLDQASGLFKVQSGLHCPSHCGACCFSSTVECSELEMLPLAFELVRLSQADEWYARAGLNDSVGRCAFYTSQDGNGRCHFYAYRPLVCRLFGYAGNNDKYGRLRLITCRVLKEDYSDQTEAVLEKVYKGELIPPVMSDLVMRVSSVDPWMSREIQPINLAFRKALERVLLNNKFVR